METTYVLKGLNCPNCAQQIETAAAELDGVASAKIDLMGQKLHITMQDGHCLGVKSVGEIVHRYEPDVIVCEEKGEIIGDDGGNGARNRVIRLVLGGIAAAASIALFYLHAFSHGVLIPLMLLAYLVLGYDVLWRAMRNIVKGQVFDENFLMALATVGAIGIGEYPEAVAVMLFYQIGELFQDRAVDKSRRHIAAMMDIRPDTARVLRGGKAIEVSPESVKIGEQIVVWPGERIPLDGKIIEGDSMLDMRALTGESVPCHVKRGDAVLSGGINTAQSLTVEATHEFGESTAAKIIDLVQKAGSRKAPAEKLMTTFAKYYTPAVVILALMLALVPPLVIGGGWSEWLNRGFVFLVISCPCALVISIPLTFFGGIGAASRHGILVKGGNYLDALNNLNTLVFDKTGTLTHGSFEVTRILPAPGIETDKLLQTAALAEIESTHPIARSILTAAHGRNIELGSLRCHHTEISGRGVRCQWDNHEILAGNAKLMDEEGIEFCAVDSSGTLVYAAENGKYIGCIEIADTLKPECGRALSALRQNGISRMIMLSGDSQKAAEAMARKTKMDEYYAELLPGDKVDKFDRLAQGMTGNKKIGFVGDGMNDAPVLARADIGIAMGGVGSDAAIEAADIVLMTDDLSRLPAALRIARYTRRIVIQNIVFALTVKAVFLIFGAFGWIGMWAAVFADVGVMVLAVLNAMRMLRVEVPR